MRAVKRSPPPLSDTGLVSSNSCTSEMIRADQKHNYVLLAHNTAWISGLENSFIYINPKLLDNNGCLSLLKDRFYGKGILTTMQLNWRNLAD